MYIGFLQYRVNYTNKDGLRAAILAGYAKAVNILFTLQGFTSPVNLSDPDNCAGMKIMNHQKEEDIAMQQYPLSSEILSKLFTMAVASCRSSAVTVAKWPQRAAKISGVDP
jgi:hypothetical protein